MKKISFLYLIIFSNLYFSQEKNTLVYYSNKKNELEKNILILKDSIKYYEERIQKYNSNKIIDDIKNLKISSTIKKGAKIREETSPLSNIIMNIENDSKVLIYDYIDDYFKVCIDDKCGFANSLWIEKTSEVEKLITAKNDIVENMRLTAQKEEQKRSIVEKQRLIKKYGKENYDKLLSGKIWLGINEEMAIIALGTPIKINNSTGSWGTHSQWVYKNFYLYFENGKLVSYQN